MLKHLCCWTFGLQKVGVQSFTFQRKQHRDVLLSLYALAFFTLLTIFHLTVMENNKLGVPFRGGNPRGTRSARKMDIQLSAYAMWANVGIK